MPDPATIALGVTTALSVGKSVFDYFSNSKLREIQNETLDLRRQYVGDLQRRARGRFTDTELQEIRMQSQPYLTQVSGNVASRGLGQSPAGARVVGEAQARPFQQARQESQTALTQLGPALAGLDQAIAGRMPQGDPQFGQLLSQIASKYVQLSQSPYDPNDGGASNSWDVINRASAFLTDPNINLNDQAQGFGPPPT